MFMRPIPHSPLVNLLVNLISDDFSGVGVVLFGERLGRHEHVLKAGYGRVEEHLDPSRISEVLDADFTRKLSERRHEPDRTVRPRKPQ